MEISKQSNNLRHYQSETVIIVELNNTSLHIFQIFLYLLSCGPSCHSIRRLKIQMTQVGVSDQTYCLLISLHQQSQQMHKTFNTFASFSMCCPFTKTYKAEYYAGTASSFSTLVFMSRPIKLAYCCKVCYCDWRSSRY